MAKKQEFGGGSGGAGEPPILRLGLESLLSVGEDMHSHNPHSPQLPVVMLLLSHDTNPRRTHSMHYAEAHQN